MGSGTWDRSRSSLVQMPFRSLGGIEKELIKLIVRPPDSMTSIQLTTKQLLVHRVTLHIFRACKRVWDTCAVLSAYPPILPVKKCEALKCHSAWQYYILSKVQIEIIDLTWQ